VTAFEGHLSAYRLPLCYYVLQLREGLSCPQKSPTESPAPKPLRARPRPAAPTPKPKPGHAAPGSPEERRQHFFRQGIPTPLRSKTSAPRRRHAEGFASITTSNPRKIFSSSSCLPALKTADALYRPSTSIIEGEPVATNSRRAIRAQIDYIIQNKVPFGLFLHEFRFAFRQAPATKVIAVDGRANNNRFVDLVKARAGKQGEIKSKAEPVAHRQRHSRHVQLALSLVRHGPGSSDPRAGSKQVFLNMLLNGHPQNPDPFECGGESLRPLRSKFPSQM